MTKLFAWLGVATLVLLPSTTRAEPLKPYVVLALDTSGSMNDPTGTGAPSCGGSDTKLNHARCAITRIVASYGDIVFGLARFRTVAGGSTNASAFPTGCTLAGPDDTGGLVCNATDDMFELLAPLVDGNNAAAGVWTNLTGNTCLSSGTDPEIWTATGNTPLEGTLRGAKDYWTGVVTSVGASGNAPQTIWPSTAPGYNPIFNDPTSGAFLPPLCDPSPACTTNCCASQCRPYIVILLTDGAETCGGTPGNGAAALLATTFNSKKYRIETKPIGFGITAPNAQIEAIAHAGGATDLPGQNEGFYANNESEVELAMSSIIEGAIRTETCNNLDDDCDGNVDEDFTGKGSTCTNGKLGECRVNGAEVCRADGTGLTCDAGAAACSGKLDGAACSVTNATGNAVAGTCASGACVPTAGVEICNGLDDDCDGLVDEGLTGCTCSPQPEICNNKDDDCDGTIDEDLTRPCGVDIGVCHAGIETCVAGMFSGCTATTGTTEICDGLDNDCDGVVDGITRACSNMPPVSGNPAGDPRNNPNLGICHPGQQICPVNSPPPHQFGACLGEVTPETEICNGIDDDCDGNIDEDTGGADCSSSCGIGKTVCVGGVLQCDSMPAMDDETCNGVDDDCDGNIDEDYMSKPCGSGQVCHGMTKCVGGLEICDGTPISQESCNCQDDDCDGTVDEDASCPAGATCVPGACECAFHCAGGEFPCPLGKTCVNDFCVTDPCFNVNCPPQSGKAQSCSNGVCVDTCSITTCTAPLICYEPTGECMANDCSTFGCPADQNCVQGTCVANPCTGVTCPTDQYCVTGQCYDSCAGKTCAADERCELGMCVKDPCGHACPYGQTCHDETMMCVPDPCTLRQCPSGQWCNPHDALCEDDPCVGTACPDPAQVCKGGTCYDPSEFLPDAGIPVHVTAGGGGCSTGGGAGLLVVLLVLRRRRR